MPSNYIPEEKVEKATVIRAIAYNPSTGSISKPITKTYFVGFDDRSEYLGYPILSLVVDPDDLFDSSRGIYISGDAYEKYVEHGGFEGLAPEDVPASFVDENGNEYERYEASNAFNEGRAWEREASLTYFDEDHSLAFAQNAGVRISGESSRWKLQKSMNLIAREIYGTTTFSYSMFENDAPTSKIRLRTDGEDDLIYLDSMLQEMASDTGLLYQRSKPCVVFLDGEYWGIYNLREQYTKEYFTNLYDIDPSNIWMVKNNETVLGDDNAAENFKGVLDQIAYADLSDQTQFNYVNTSFDLENIAQFYALMTYIDNQDVTDIHNRAAWRTIENDGSPMGDARWRYMLYDLDVSCNDPSFNTIEYYESLGDVSYLPQYFQANQDFKAFYCKTMMNLANITYSSRRAEQAVNDWEQKYEKQIAKRHVRFMDSDTSMADYLEQLEDIRAFFRERRAYMQQFLAEDLGIDCDIENITIKKKTQDGTVLVNGTALNDVDYDEQIWKGEYFRQYPITLSVNCDQGENFIGWYDQNTG